MSDQTARLTWRETPAGEVPVSTCFDDPYFSLAGGVAETEHVFLAGNDLPARFRDDFHVAELGFGTGLNFLTCLRAWRAAGVAGTLRYTSFEAFPLAPADLARALAGTTDLPIALLTKAQDPTRIDTPDVCLRIITGDARETLARWPGRADAWFLDGFSPAKNPELWEPALLREVARHTTPGGTFATYTAAGTVRRALAEAGFTVERRPGFDRKRHMTLGSLDPYPSSSA